MANFSTERISDLTGRTVVVTGGSSGLGRATARVLAAKGARVVLAVRDRAKGDAAAATMTGDVVVRRLDLADLTSIGLFVEDFVRDFAEPIDVLINNAGMVTASPERTVDGFEPQFGTNHLGHFALTNLLLPRIRGRVVTVTSDAHKFGTIDFDDLNWERRRYRALSAYAQSKLANLLFTSELQRRLTEVGSPVLTTAAHPGLASTDIYRSLAAEWPWPKRVGLAAMTRFAQSEDGGALPILYAAVADIPGGSFAAPGGFMQARGAPTVVEPAKPARDAAVARRLWTVSEELTGITFPLAATDAPR